MTQQALDDLWRDFPRTARAALSASKPAAARITSPGRSGHSGMMSASSRLNT